MLSTIGKAMDFLIFRKATSFFMYFLFGFACVLFGYNRNLCVPHVPSRHPLRFVSAVRSYAQSFAAAAAGWRAFAARLWEIVKPR